MRSKTQRRWSTEEIEFLKVNYSKMTAEEISVELSISKSSVFTKASELKLKNKKILESRITLDKVIDFLNEHGVKVLSKENIKSDTKLELQCKCGIRFQRTFTKCKDNSPICISCTKEKRLGYEEALGKAIEFIEDNGLKLLMYEQYNGRDTKFKVKCKCGKEEAKSIRSLITNPCCSTCARVDCGKNNLSNEEVSKIISENSECKLISTNYVDRNSLIKLKCSCDDEFETYIDRFLVDKKRQCNKCGIARRSGENNPLWKGGVTSANNKLRSSTEYRNWRLDVFKRDDYTCQCCGDISGGNLQAHHILNFSDNKDEVLSLTNAVTMCAKCHDFRNYGSFHHMYGTRENDEFQLQEYFDDIRSALGLPLIQIEDIIYPKELVSI